MLTEREEMVVDWLRNSAECGDYDFGPGIMWAADMIEAGEHLKRPSPTIPFEDWRDVPSVGH